MSAFLNTLRNTKAIFKTGASIICVSTLLLGGTPAQAEEDPNPALWSLSDEDSQIYLFGTIHILNPSLNWQTQKMSDALAASDVVYFEAPADSSNPTKTQKMVMQYGLNAPGVTLSSMLSEQGKEDLDTILTQFGMAGAAANFEPLKPWLVAITLAAIQIQAQGGDPEAGVEKIIQKMIDGSGKSTRYFETDEQQIQLLSGMTPEGEIAFLEDGLRSMIEEPDALNDMVEHWISGNPEALGVLMHEALSGSPEVYEILLTRRNKNWANTIDTLMKGSGTIFIAVGAAHLAGDDSVQALLEEKGYTVHRH